MHRLTRSALMTIPTLVLAGLLLIFVGLPVAGADLAHDANGSARGNDQTQGTPNCVSLAVADAI